MWAFTDLWGEMSTRNTLESALRALTMPISVSGAIGTGCYIAPGLVLTCAHVLSRDGEPPAEVTTAQAGTTLSVVEDSVRPAPTDLALLRAKAEPAPRGYPWLAEAVQPGDELWAFGYPGGEYRSGDSVTFRYEGPSELADGTVLLRAARGQISPGFSGAPVLNWRSGAICGVIVRRRKDTATTRMIPVRTVLAEYPYLARWHEVPSGHRDWLELLDDEQLRAAGWAYPGPRMRGYLRAARKADSRHPYAHLLSGAPPLAKVYLRQQVTEQRGDETGKDEPTDVELRVLEADELMRYPGAQVIGGPGIGKSSLLKHLTAVSAGTWLDEARGEFVPVLVSADALARQGLTDALADGVVQELDTELDRSRLVELFGAQPLPGVPWLVLADGLDEILDQEARDRVLGKIAQHREDLRYRFLLSSRSFAPAELRKVADPDRYPTFVVEPFTDGRLREFAVRWFDVLELADIEGAADRFMAQFRETRLGELARIPLISTMLCILFAEYPRDKLPFNRADLYKRFIEWLLSKYQRRPEKRAALRARVSTSGQAAEHAFDELSTTAGLRKVLQGLAYARQGLACGEAALSPVDWVLTRSGVVLADDLPEQEWREIIRELLGVSGLFIQRRDDFRFLHQTIEEYLAACHLYDKHQDPTRPDSRKLLMPQRKWPWPNLEVKVFLVARWMQADPTPDLTPQLRRLLWPWNRRNNIDFLVELERQAIGMPAPVRKRTVDLLARSVTSQRLSTSDWSRARDGLATLDRERAIKVLRPLATDRRVNAYRQFEAVRALVELDADDVVDILLSHVTEEGFAAHHREQAGEMLIDVFRRSDPDALAELTDKPELGTWRISAAEVIAETDPELATTVLERLSIPGYVNRIAVPAAVALAERDPDHGCRRLVELSEDARLASTERLAAAIQIGKWDPEQSLELLANLVGDRTMADTTRLEAALAVKQRAPSMEDSQIRALAVDETVDPGVRLTAIGHISNRSARLISLLRLADDTTAAVHTRLEACRQAGVLNPIDGATKYAAISREKKHASGVRLDAAKAALDLDQELGHAALAGLVDTLPDPADRLAAARAAAKRQGPYRVELLRKVATNPESGVPIRREAAEVIIGYRHRRQGTAVLESLALGANVPIDTRIEIALRICRLASGNQGLNLLLRLTSAPDLPVPDRIAAATAAGRYSTYRAGEALAELAKNKHHAPADRMCAVRELAAVDKKKAAEVYGMLAGDRRLGDDNQMTAAEELARLNRSAGAAAFRELSRVAVSRQVRTRAEQEADRLGG